MKTRLGWCAAVLLVAGCQGGAEKPAGHGHGAAAGHAEGGHGNEGHGHAHGDEGSDLDVPVDELFARGCEHDVKAFECAECRYEVGVARVPAPLLEEELVSTAPLGKRPVTTAVPLTGAVTSTIAGWPTCRSRPRA